jgi:hypothetical protein
VFERLLARAWTLTKRPILKVYLGVFRGTLCAEALVFVDETIDAGYATYRTLATVRVPVESLFTVQLGHGPIPIDRTPHYSFVRAHLGHEGAGWNRNDWKKYMTHDSAAVAQRQERFEKLIDEIRKDPADVNLLVAINPSLRGFEIVDGFFIELQ